MNILIASKIQEDSWLHEPRFKRFLKAYYYAATQTLAIPVLAKVTPEELYHAYQALKYGEED